MEEEFTTYSERPRKYYVFLSINILYLILWGLILTHRDIADKYVFITCILIFVGLIAVVTGIILTVLSKMYVPDGTLRITLKNICVDKEVISIDDIEDIEIDSNDYKGARTSDGSGNKISILTKHNKRYTYQFVINSRSQRNNLKQILKRSEEAGIPIGQMGFGR